jgi:hypothetical protein
MIYAAASLMEMMIVILLQHHIKGELRWWHLAVILLILGGLTLGPLMGAIAAFGYEAVKLKYPAYEQWRLVQLGAFVSHVDFLSIYQWISGAFIRISLSLFLLIDLLQLKNKKHRMIGTVFFGIAMLIAMSFIKLSDNLYMIWIRNYYFAVFGSVLLLSLLLFVLVLTKTKRKGTTS